MKPKKIVLKKPAEKKKPENQQKNYFETLKGQKVVVQTRAGTRYEGLFEAYKDGFFWLKEAVIIGNKFKVETDLVAVDRGQTAHLHLFPKSIEELPEEGEAS
ncbi:hypothetical protein Thein_1186 [Thermodesulfatator indicus DSM 15286]|uniref:Uncharacterized protein n=1 Tax=Thermodesulfatator indicus (strain DSM 15286 / JCM 11887 / CIR29812) TaxID=667014 RepID=F8A855_THEID|nr:hypothetical protein [Thermodesulfatator indicus]AEH45054.1 hypothetical protein Thein_1186 [Thermodesulfatator indicus DSM 15286]